MRHRETVAGCWIGIDVGPRIRLVATVAFVLGRFFFSSTPSLFFGCPTGFGLKGSNLGGEGHIGFGDFEAQTLPFIDAHLHLQPQRFGFFLTRFEISEPKFELGFVCFSLDSRRLGGFLERGLFGQSTAQLIDEIHLIADQLVEELAAQG